MTILSAQSIRSRRILDPCLPAGKMHGTSYGLGPAGYDLRLSVPPLGPLTKATPGCFVHNVGQERVLYVPSGAFVLVSAIEKFTMPHDLVGIVHDKSTWARRGLACQNTIIEPGWCGYLTLELTNHGPDPLVLLHDQGIAQVVFHVLDQPTEAPYDGKYQHQGAGAQPAR